MPTGPQLTEELAFILRPFANLRVYGGFSHRMALQPVSAGEGDGLFLQIEQHSFFLLFIKLVASLALSMPESLTGQLREACLGQLAVCAPQLKAAFHAGVQRNSRCPLTTLTMRTQCTITWPKCLTSPCQSLGSQSLVLQLTSKGFFLHMCLRDLDQFHQRPHPLPHHRLLQSATGRHWIEQSSPKLPLARYWFVCQSSSCCV